MSNPAIKPTPWSYFLIRLLFKFVLKVFYGTVVLENEQYIPDNGQACIICANHCNSLTDAVLLIASISSKKRNLLRLTAKDTQFGRKTFTSWLIENAGTVPVQRRTEHGNAINNTAVMSQLSKALGEGDIVCMFPEGMSRYQSRMSPLKTGVARILSDVLTQKQEDPNFEITLLTCSITYMHRQRFRSDVLVSFNPPLKLRPSEHPSLLSTPTHPVQNSTIKSLTAFMEAQISSGTIDAPTWNVVRTAKTAARIYAPLGTQMRLGDWVRLVRTFVDAFSKDVGGGRPRLGGRNENWAGGEEVMMTPGEEKKTEDITEMEHDARIDQLASDLREYQNALNSLRLKDDRIRRPPSRRSIPKRLALRLLWLLLLSALALPGMVLWAPIFGTAAYAVWKFKKTGPVWDVFDEIAQYKLIYGLGSGLAVWIAAVCFTWPIALVTVWAVPLWMWMTLRWFEDAVATFRACVALARLFFVPPGALKEMLEVRNGLHGRVMDLAVGRLELPEDPERWFSAEVEPSSTVLGGEGKRGESPVRTYSWTRENAQKGRVRGRWDWGAGYFSIKRRRKRDWNEALRWYDITEEAGDGRGDRLD